ncbi:MAG: hypothetical protein QOC81_1407 [Thermoanaerobaculia bacterium]|jgi:hypothetical protein|nr:hypothetical protein [Thermoanaerobaculia bacterium]
MTFAVLLLSGFFMAAPAASDPAIESQISGFVHDWQSGSAASAYEHMSQEARASTGLTQLSAYLDSRQRALGPPLEVKNIRLAKEIDEEHGLTMYEADIRFQKGTAASWFVMAHEQTGWRIARLGVDLPQGIAAALDEKEILPIVREMLSLVKADGTGALAPRLSKEALAYSKLDVKSARELMTRTSLPLGALNDYTLSAPVESGDRGCWQTSGEASFQYGEAAIRFDLCWSDGNWRLQHFDAEAHMTPVMVERTLMILLENSTVSCPHDAPYPIGAEIQCTISKGGESKTARILRTGESGIKLVGIVKAGS